MFSHREWSKRKYAEDPDYREKRRALQRAYRQSHKKQILEQRRRRRASDPAYRERELTRERNWRRKKTLETVYGISLEHYQAMVERQGGLCAICNKKSDKTLCVDHCHATGRVRGLLCSSCNSMLGFSQDDPSRLAAGIVYLRASRSDTPARAADRVDQSPSGSERPEPSTSNRR